jgi:hypothetical protein
MVELQTIQVARRIVAEHERPGAHVWSESIARGWDWEAAACDECEAARQLVAAADARAYSRQHDARFAGRNW